ncbi:MAG: selenium cofactor biosynthesis protein YqeC [Proteobacteria bacterium]|nr:selenium cofactor biosynthesis protein YqeC [Pseudomonadota bacterium]
MWHFQKIDLVTFLSNFRFVTYVGSGGKTAFIELCARGLSRRGKSVAITTTTKIFAREPYVLAEDGAEWTKNLGFMRIGKTMSQGKLTGLEFDEIERLGSVYDFVLTEADGAKGKPMKFPAPYEPVIPPFSEMICVLCGLDGLLGRVDEKVFRWELFSQATGIDGTAPVTPQVFLRFFSGDTLLKGVDIERCTVVLNKYDVLRDRGLALELAKEIIQKTGVQNVIIASSFFNVFYMVRKI